MTKRMKRKILVNAVHCLAVVAAVTLLIVLPREVDSLGVAVGFVICLVAYAIDRAGEKREARR